MKEIMDKDGMRRSLVRMAHEIVEKNKGIDNLVLVGIRTRGEYLAKRIAEMINRFEDCCIPCCGMDIRYWRDDQKAIQSDEIPPLPVDVEDKIIVLVDDVLHKGRTVRAAMDGIMDYGRAREIHLAVLVDRGHRELPIRADYVGKNVPTSLEEDIQVKVLELDGLDGVFLKGRE